MRRDQLLPSAARRAAWRGSLWVAWDIAGDERKWAWPVDASAVVLTSRTRFECVEALDRIIIRRSYPPSNAISYMHLQL